MKIEVYNSFETVKDLWETFQSKALLYPFQTYEWLSSWYGTIGVKENIEPYIITIRSSEENQLILLLPLGIQKIGIMKRLIWLGGKVTDYNGPIINPNFKFNNHSNITLLIKEIIKILPPLDLVYFKKMPAKIGRLNNPLLNQECFFQVDSSQLLINTDWENYFKNQLKASKRDILRKEKKLTTLGNWYFKVAQTEAEIRKITLTMIKQKSRRYQETKKNDMFKHQHYQDFYLSTALNFPQNSNNPKELKTFVAALYLNDQIIATQWGIQHRNSLYYLMPSYEGGELSKCSPGKIMLAKLAEWCFSNGIKVFDLTYGEESYKKDWCNAEMKLYQYFSPVSMKGRGVLFLYRLIQNYRHRPKWKY